MAHSGDVHPMPPPLQEPLPETSADPSPALVHPPASGSQKTLAATCVIAFAVLLVAIVASILSRIASDRALKNETLDAASLPVATVHPSAAATIDEITLPGSAQAFLNTPIYARTSGYLKSWNVDIGEHVKQGQLLAEIDTPEVDQQLEQSRANLNNARANLDISQITAARLEGLFKSHTVSVQERDQAASDLAAKQALVDSGDANVRRLEQMKAFELVQAPFAGIITARNTDIGALIQAGGATGTKELFHLADNHMLRVFFSVPEVYSSTIKSGETMQIVFDSVPGESFTGELVRDSASLDPLSHTLMVEADVQNPNGRLFPGGHATVHLKLPSAEGTVSVPANALLYRDKGTQLALVRDGHIAIIPIQIARDHGDNVEILGGVSAQDSVVIDPPDSLTDGIPARVEKSR